MQIKLVQDSIIFISAITAEQFEKAKKFIPESLTLYQENDKKKTPICALDYAHSGSVNKNGIVFDATTDSGKLCHTVVNAEGFDPHLDTEKKLRIVSEKYSSLILRMNALEEQILSDLNFKEAEITTAQASISAVSIDTDVSEDGDRTNEECDA